MLLVIATPRPCEEYTGRPRASQRKWPRRPLILQVVQTASAAYRPGKAVGLFAGVDVTGYFQRFQIDDGDVAIRRAGYVRARAIRLHQDAGRAMSNLHPL